MSNEQNTENSGLTSSMAEAFLAAAGLLKNGEAAGETTNGNENGDANLADGGTETTTVTVEATEQQPSQEEANNEPDDNSENDNENEEPADEAGKTFTQAYVTKIRNEAAEYRTKLKQANETALRYQVALQHGLSKDDAALLSGDEKTMNALAARLAGTQKQVTQKTEQPPVGFGIDSNRMNEGTPSNEDAAAKLFFGL